MNISAIKYFSTVNGEGFRTAVFVSGCDLHCKGCFNKVAWDYNTGKLLDERIEDKILQSIEPTYIKGLSILGGEPMSCKNQAGVNRLIDRFRLRFGEKKTIWLWTGYPMQRIPHTSYTQPILDKIDVIVDGPFDNALFERNLQFRGSSNQRIIYLHR